MDVNKIPPTMPDFKVYKTLDGQEYKKSFAKAWEDMPWDPKGPQPSDPAVRFPGYPDDLKQPIPRFHNNDDDGNNQYESMNKYLKKATAEEEQNATIANAKANAAVLADPKATPAEKLQASMRPRRPAAAQAARAIEDLKVQKEKQTDEDKAVKAAAKAARDVAVKAKKQAAEEKRAEKLPRQAAEEDKKKTAGNKEATVVADNDLARDSPSQEMDPDIIAKKQRKAIADRVRSAAKRVAEMEDALTVSEGHPAIISMLKDPRDAGRFAKQYKNARRLKGKERVEWLTNKFKEYQHVHNAEDIAKLFVEGYGDEPVKKKAKTPTHFQLDANAEDAMDLDDKHDDAPVNATSTSKGSKKKKAPITAAKVENSDLDEEENNSVQVKTKTAPTEASANAPRKAAKKKTKAAADSDSDQEEDANVNVETNTAPDWRGVPHEAGAPHKADKTKNKTAADDFDFDEDDDKPAPIKRNIRKLKGASAPKPKEAAAATKANVVRGDSASSKGSGSSVVLVVATTSSTKAANKKA